MRYCHLLSRNSRIFNLAYYRITRLKALDMVRIKKFMEGMRVTLEKLGADFIDIVEDDEGNIAVVARYPDESTMEAATATAQDAFGQMVTEGAADGSSIDQWSGQVTLSY